MSSSTAQTDEDVTRLQTAATWKHHSDLNISKSIDFFFFLKEEEKAEK